MSDMKRLEEKVDKLDGRLDSIDVTLAKNTVLLDEHIRRTQLLEQEIVPLRKHSVISNFVISAILATVPIAIAIYKLFL